MLNRWVQSIGYDDKRVSPCINKMHKGMLRSTDGWSYGINDFEAREET